MLLENIKKRYWGMFFSVFLFEILIVMFHSSSLGVLTFYFMIKVKDYDAALDLELDSMEKFVLQCLAFYQVWLILYISMCVCTYIHTYIRVHPYTHTYIYMHICNTLSFFYIAPNQIALLCMQPGLWYSMGRSCPLLWPPSLADNFAYCPISIWNLWSTSPLF